jgi:hypothetical protein
MFHPIEVWSIEEKCVVSPHQEAEGGRWHVDGTTLNALHQLARGNKDRGPCLDNFNRIMTSLNDWGNWGKDPERLKA